MAASISTNMGLIVPTVGSEPGPTWASDLNSSLGIIDQHNHTTGQGVQIPTAGLNINTDLPINGNNIKTVKTVNFTAQSGTLAGSSPNLGCIYVAGNELVYNDEAGHVVPITNNGSVNSGAGSITGLPSGTASATYNSGSSTFVWQSATNTPANMDGGSFTFRNITASSHGVTVKAPSALGADYILVLPTVPSTTSFVTVDNAGNMGSATSQTAGITGSMIAANTVTVSNLAAFTGQQISSSCGVFAISPGSSVPVTNLSVTITTKGGPIYIGLIADPTTAPTSTSYWQCIGSIVTASLILYSGSSATTVLAQYIIQPAAGAGSLIVPAPSLLAFDVPSAGSQTYTVYANVSAGASANLANYRLIAYEL